MPGARPHPDQRHGGKLKVVRQAALQVQPPTPPVREVRRAAGARSQLQARPYDDRCVLERLGHRQPHAVQPAAPIDVKSAVQGLLMYPRLPGADHQQRLPAGVH